MKLSMIRMYLNTRMLILFISEFIIIQTISSQELEFQKRCLSTRIVEEFYVLKNNKEIKEGQYKLLIDNFICQTGFYTNNQRSGLWAIFCCSNQVVPGPPEIVYNYDTNKLIYFEKDFYFSREDSTLRLPIYLGGIQYFKESILNHLDINQTRWGNGGIYISFEVDSTGLAKDIKLKSSCDNKSLDLMAIDAVKKVATSDFKFLPARRYGNSISYTVEVPIIYTSMNIQVIPYD